jgi:hypothetical protein
MKTKQIHLKKKSDVLQEINSLQDLAPQLLMVFATADDLAVRGLAQTLTREFPKATVVGCSTSGEITSRGAFGGTTVIQACHFDSAVQLKAVSEKVNGMKDSLECGRRLGRKLKQDPLKFVFLLGCGLNINGSLLLKGLQEVIGKDIVVTGGLAGDDEKFLKTFTLLNDEISDHSVVAVGFSGGDVQISYGSMGGWEPFGPIRRVTRSEDNIMYEIDGEPALEVYKRYLGDRTKDLPSSGLLFPFAILKDNQDTSGLIRTILNVDEKTNSLIFAGDIPENGLVQLMHSSNGALTAGAKQASEFVLEKTPGDDENALGILVSCVGRKLVMGNDIDDELDAVHDVLKRTPVVGFYSYGEICPQHGFQECKLHNQTMTITYLYEKKTA